MREAIDLEDSRYNDFVNSNVILTKTSLAILRFISANPKIVGDIERELNLTATKRIRHIKKLLEYKLVEVKRMGFRNNSKECSLTEKGRLILNAFDSIEI